MSVPAPIPRFEVTDGSGRTVVHMRDCPTLTEENASAIREHVGPLIAMHPAGEICIDLGGIEFLSSAALAEFIHLHRKVVAGGGHLALLNLRPMVRTVFTISGLDRLFDIRTEPVTA